MVYGGTVHQAILASAARYWETIASCPLRFIRSASAPLPRHVLAKLEMVFKGPVIEAYGMTETSGPITSNPLSPRARKPGSVGVAAGAEVSIMRPEGASLPTGEIGEVVARDSTVFQGYENDPRANRSAFTDSWFRTGDQGSWIVMATSLLPAASKKSSPVGEKKLPCRKWIASSWSILQWPRR
jgi:acyl-CoA synthetase (AMP-forming)/AMP-acid ligase II